MQQIQFIQTSPEQFKDELFQALKAEINTLKREFQPKEPTKYLTRSDVAEMLQIDLSTLHHWTKKGKLRSYGIGNRVYYKRHEVDAALQQFNK